MTGVQSAWLTKAQSHSGLVRSSKFLEIVGGQSSRNLWCGSEKPSSIQWCSYTSICLSICSIVKLLGDRVMQNKRFVLILTKLGLRIALEDRTPIISGARHVTNSISSFRVVTRLARHNVVAPLLAAPLLTDFRRSTVGQVRVRTCADQVHRAGHLYFFYVLVVEPVPQCVAASSVA